MRRLVVGLGLAILAALSACGGGGGGGGPPPPIDGTLIGSYSLDCFFYNFSDGSSIDCDDVDSFYGNLILGGDGRYSLYFTSTLNGQVSQTSDTGFWETYVLPGPSSDGRITLRSDAGGAEFDGYNYGNPFGPPDFVVWNPASGTLPAGNWIYAELDWTRD